MDAAGAGFVGDWDLYSGPMHSVLQLAATGQYTHTLSDNMRRHWGVWDIENQQGAQFLVLRLQGAFPMTEAGVMGWQQVQWPAWEAWAVLKDAGDTITLANAIMVRKQIVPVPGPVYQGVAPILAPVAGGFPPMMAMPPPMAAGALAPPPLPPFAPIPRPPVMPAAPAPIAAAAPPATVAATPAATATAPATAGAPQTPGAAPTPPAPVPQSVIDQWKAQSDSWNAMRNVVSNALQNDMATTQTINNMYSTAAASRLDSAMQNTQRMSDVVHRNAQTFIQSLRS